MEREVVTHIATPDDANALARLNGLFNRVVEPAQTLALRMENACQIEIPILAEIEGCVVGFAAVRVVPCVCDAAPYAELTELFVEEAWRRRGVGRALMEHAENVARENGATSLLLMVGFGNADAQAFYRALGYGDCHLAMEKKLVFQEQTTKQQESSVEIDEGKNEEN